MFVIHPVTSLAFAVQSQPGVYAALIGSGVSRSAQIPTGWGIVNDLVRRLAVAEGDTIAGDPAAWYLAKYGSPVGFSTLLSQLAGARTERQALLRSFIEPDPAKPDERRPTAAHRALASLARAGHLRAFITTNFDRLLEQALVDEGMSPIVVANVAAAAGAAPFHHAAVIVFKLHGDYLDPDSMLVTEDELSAYETPVADRLARTLEDYGLIVCGWSGEWDPALRSAITAATSRRYPLYFASRGAPSAEGQEVVDLRGGTVVEIAGADEFFSDLERRVASIERFSQPHPLDSAALVAEVKAALPRPDRRIELEDLVIREANRVHDALADVDAFPQHRAGADVEWMKAYLDEVDRARALSDPIARVLAAGAAWGEASHNNIWTRGIERVANTHGVVTGTHQENLTGLWRLPALLCTYAVGIAAVDRGNYGALRAVTVEPRFTSGRGEVVPLIGALNVWDVAPQHVVANALANREALADDIGDARIEDILQGRATNYYAPLAHVLKAWLRVLVADLVPDGARFDELFESVEVLLDLLAADVDATVGLYTKGTSCGLYATGRFYDDRPPPEKRIESTFNDLGADWPPLVAGLFGGQIDRAAAAFGRVIDDAEKVRGQRH